MTDNIKEVAFFNIHDGIRGRDGGPYLDQIERQRAEIARAKVEGREPADLDGPLPGTAGSPLVVAEVLFDNVASNPSMSVNFVSVDSHDASDETHVAPVIVLPVDFRTEVSDNLVEEDVSVEPYEPVVEPVVEPVAEPVATKKK